ncbi:Phage integrase (Site-specific recombinase) [Lachnospiraceae bacterium TWA4]|nr:Phage integrase (Site-specific recombinase) [Lachnospiraceae bacterium TWA4]
MIKRKVTQIPATIDKFTAIPVGSKQKRKVAGYARVSTDHEDQTTSYEAQVDYYTNYIKSREDWVFAGLYSDEGITATNTKHRDGFNQMIADALEGKIDLIITKSVSRFARNTVDSLSTIRKLKEHNVECYFEKENIWTFDSKGELLLTIMSSLAQEESRSISENVTWGHRKRFADGKVSFAYSQVLGLEKDADGNIVVNQEQAVIVKLIFKLFLEGMTPHSIAVRLTNQGIKSPKGKDRWNSGTVRRMLSNEKYKGDVLLQKTFTIDYLSKRTKKNEGEVPQYYIEGNHEAIIEPAVFDLVQLELEKRSRKDTSKYSGVSIFSNKIKCAECGSWYGAKVWHSTDKYRRIIYQCNHKFSGNKKCQTPHVVEYEIKKAFVQALNQLISEKEEVIANIELIRNTVTKVDALEEKLENLRNEIEVIVEMTNACMSENARIIQNQEEYQKRYDGLVERYNKLKVSYDKVEGEIEKKKALSEKLNLFIKVLNDSGDLVTEFDTGMWGSLLDFVTVDKSKMMKFTFKDGTEIEVE